MHSSGAEGQSSILSVLESVVQQASAGLIILHRTRLVMANPAALQTLGLAEDAAQRILSVDSPNGMLIERIAEASAGDGAHKPASFNYMVPLADGNFREITCTINRLPADHTLVELRIIPPAPAPHLDAEKLIGQLRHRFKTPLAVMTLGLSHFSRNYAKLTDEERLAIVEETAQQVQRLTAFINTQAQTK